MNWDGNGNENELGTLPPTHGRRNIKLEQQDILCCIRTQHSNGCPLEFSTKEGYIDDKNEVGKLRTARGKKTNQILGPHHAKVPLAAEEMTRWCYRLVLKAWVRTCSLRDGRGPNRSLFKNRGSLY